MSLETLARLYGILESYCEALWLSLKSLQGLLISLDVVARMSGLLEFTCEDCLRSCGYPCRILVGVGALQRYPE